MRRVALILAAAFAAACSKPETPPAAEAPPPPAPSIDLAALAGTWASQTTAEGSDSVLVNGTITASADAAWTMSLPGRDPIPLTVTVSGDSLLTSMGPFESVLRKGVQVTTTGVLHLKDGKLTGPMVAHYVTTGADSVKSLWMTATRNP